IFPTAQVTFTGPTAARTITLPDSSFTIAIPNTAIWVGAAEMIPSTTNGAGVNSSETTTNKVNYDTLDFDATTSESAQFTKVMPSNYNGGTVTATFYWTLDSLGGGGTVIYTLAGEAFADNGTIDTDFGTAVGATDTAQTASAVHISPATAAVTIAGTPTASKLVQFKVARDVSDTFTTDARLIGVLITYTPQ
ncbi:MAG: hypothetical protein K8R87_01100, partial [Verrucomicrobia bacterium]|nr:hypothetical protein [Verrucomicrobiota bacterium]